MKKFDILFLSLRGESVFYERRGKPEKNKNNNSKFF